MNPTRRIVYRALLFVACLVFVSIVAPRLAAGSALQLAAAVARASLVITDAAGIAEMADDLGTPVIEITEDPGASRSTVNSHHLVCAPSRSRVTTDEVYEPACALIQSSRSAQLFRD